MMRNATATVWPVPPNAGGRLHRAAGLIRSRPLTAFFSWFFTVGQLIAFTPAISSAVFQRTLAAEPFIIASTFVGLLLPAVAITAAMDGPEGLRRLSAAALRYRIPARWYLLALVGVPTITLGVQAVTAGRPSNDSPGAIAAAVGIGLIVQLIVVMLTVNLWEEVAWTGFVQALLQRQGHSPMRAALLVAPLFALGHISLLTGGLGQAATLLLLLTALGVPFRALQGWVYNRTGSLLIVGAIHAAGNAAALGSIAGAGLIPRLYGGEGQSLLAFALIGLLVITLTKARLGGKRQYLR